MSVDPTFGTAEIVFSAPTTVTANFTNNGPELGAALSGFALELDLDAGPTSLTQVMSLRAPVTFAKDRQLIGYVQEIQFGIKKPPDVRVLIVADLAGTVKTVEFDFEGSTAPVLDDQIRIVQFFSPQGLETSGAGLLGLSGPVADYAATISVTIQRRTLKGQGSIHIDLFDVDAILTNPTTASA
jgi:hypothetical protein